MDEKQIKEAIAAFKSHIKPVKEGETTIKATEPPPKPKAPPTPPVHVPGPETAMPVGACFYLPFKTLVAALAETYIGKHDAKLWLLQQPDCPEEAS